MTPAVKFCGICTQGDARAAVAAGADYVGVILAPGFHRSQTPDDAAVILDGCGAERVGVFVDQDIEYVLDAAARLDLRVLQLHGGEAAGAVAELRAEASRRELPVRIWKTVHANRTASLVAECDAWKEIVDGVLLDGGVAGTPGGSGASFDWDRAAHMLARSRRVRPIIAAGGLTPHNVAAAIALLAPDVVDVSSGIEDRPGMKSPALMRAFVAAARGEHAPSGIVE